MLLRILLAFNALAAAVVLFFFFWGVSDGTVSSLNIGIWLALLAATALSLGGGWFFYAKGNRAVALLVLMILALPGLAFLAFTLLLLIANPRWN